MHPVIRMHTYDYHRSAAHSAQWQELELILRQLLQHGNMLEKRERVVYASLSPAETFMRACRTRRPMHWSSTFPSFKGFYDMHTQAVSVSYRHAKRCVHYVHVYANSDRRIFLTRKRRHACMSYIRMKSVLLIWTSSLNDRSKLKGQYTDVKSGCNTSGWPSLNHHSLSLKTFLVLLSL